MDEVQDFELLTPADLVQYPEFELDPIQPPKETTKQKVWRVAFEGNEYAVVRKRFKMGDTICREGEYVYTAFYILEGSAKVFLSSPIAHVKTDGGERKGGIFGFLRQLTGLANRGDDRREGEIERTYIPIDATVDLPYHHPVAILAHGDLFGEMSCLSLYPRSATVVANTDCVVLEMQRTALDILCDPKKGFNVFRAKIESNYRERSFANHLRGIKEFSSLSDEFINYLKKKIEIRRCEPGDTICTQGEESDALYLIRIGFVQVSQKHPGGEMVIAYLSRGQYFGEMGLLTGEPRSATCKALDHVDVVKITRELFNEMLEKFPQVRGHLEAEAARRKGQLRRLRESSPHVPLDSFLEQGLMNAQNVLLIDLDRCTRCDECVHACASAHDSISRLLRDGLRYENYLVTTSCRQCTDPICMIGCPVGSIRRRESLEVIIEDWCIGCKICADNCPYGNIAMHEFTVDYRDLTPTQKKKAKILDTQGEFIMDKLVAEAKALEAEKETEKSVKKRKAKIQKATTCDLCTNLEEPSCVYACPHDAAIRVNPSQFFSEKLKERET